MVKRFHPLLIAMSLATPCSAVELSEADFLGELPVVLTASRLSQPVQDAPNSISVIDRAMIDASGFQNLAELFQLVPGFYVAQKSGYGFSVASGLVDEFPRQMQVLVDGRSVYQPSIGGVQWDALPLAIVDIDRIEVVRGPDADSYGANAMMGVINIITRHPAEVEGRILSVTAGSENRRDILFRWAGGDTSKHRITLAWQQNDGFTGLNDSTRAPLFNYAGDIDVGPGRSLNLRMGYIGGTRGAGDLIGDGTALPHDQHVASQFQQFDYRASLADGGEWLFKAYHNYLMDKETVPYGSSDPVAEIGNVPVYLLPGDYSSDVKTDRWHAETQWNQPLSDALRVTVGGYVRRDVVNSPLYFGSDDNFVASSRGVFSHAEWRLAREWLLNAGAMWEDHDLVGSRVSPHLALSWQPSPSHTIRIGVSRAYRDPVEVEKNADYALTYMTTAGPYTDKRLVSNPAIQPERDLSREIGYLGNWPELGLTAEIRVHRDSLHGLTDFVPVSAATNTYQLANVGESTHRGVDGQVRWRFAPRSFVQLNYAYLHIDTTLNQTPYFPPHIGGLLVSHRLSNDVDVSLGYYQSDTLVMLSSDKPPAYHRTDLRIAKEFKQGGHRARVAFILQDLGEPNYGFNYSPSVPNRDKISRQGFLQYQADY